MKEALFYKKLKNKYVKCVLCPNFCTINEGNYGSCRVRKNIGGKLYALTYGKPCSTAIDPIEKKPLFHFLPGKNAYSIATVGCNLHCKFCQNWQISQAYPNEIPFSNLEPEEVVEDAIANKCKIISYTYTEPTIFYEYVFDIAKIARKKGLKNTMITNGYINLEPLRKLYKYIDGANVDLKSFSDEFYRKICFGKLEPILDAIKEMKKLGVWIELTNLIIPTLNDEKKQIQEMCKWIVENVGKDCPLHFSRFFPMYKLTGIEPTPKSTLIKAMEIAKNEGIEYVYMGNLFVEKEENTYCPKCGELIIKRAGFSVLENKIKNGKCPKCGKKISGVWR